MPADQSPITLDTGRDPWDQQPGETDAQFRRFLAYLRAGAARSVRDTAEMLSMDLAKPLSPAYLKRVAWRHHWSERAAAWDAEQHRIHLARLDEQRREMITDQLKDAAELRAALRRALATLDPDAMSWAELARIADTLTKIERAALGEPSATVAVHGVAGAPPITMAALPATEHERQEQLRQIAARLADSVADLDPADLDPADWNPTSGA